MRSKPKLPRLPSSRAAMRNFFRKLRQACALPAEIPPPAGGWDALTKRLKDTIRKTAPAPAPKTGRTPSKEMP